MRGVLAENLIKEFKDLVYKTRTCDVVEDITEILNTIYLFNPTSLLYLVWLIANEIMSFLIIEYDKFKAVKGE